MVALAAHTLTKAVHSLAHSEVGTLGANIDCIFIALSVPFLAMTICFLINELNEEKEQA